METFRTWLGAKLFHLSLRVAFRDRQTRLFMQITITNSMLIAQKMLSSKESIIDEIRKTQEEPDLQVSPMVKQSDSIH